MYSHRLTIAAVIALGSLVTPAARAITGCSTTNLYGSYALQFSGSSTAASAKGIFGLALPPATSGSGQTANTTSAAAGIGRISFDGSGSATGTSSFSLAGKWMQGAVNGQYNVNSDCTLSLSLTDSTGGTEQFSGVAVGAGDTVYLVQTDSGTGVVGLLRRTRGSCQVSDLVGTYAIQYSANSASSPASSSVGLLTLDGSGSASSTEWRFADGAAAQVSSSGTITVNADCTAMISLTSLDSSAKTVNFSALISADERQMALVEADAGTTTAGSAIAQ
jgi:hypothetical protein